MKKLYLSAPLSFVGQKRMFAREFIKVLEQFKDKTVFVDLPRSFIMILTVTADVWKRYHRQMPCWPICVP